MTFMATIARNAARPAATLMPDVALEPRAARTPGPTPLLLMRSVRESYAALARGLAYLFGLGSLFASMAMVISPPVTSRSSVLVLIGVGVAAAALLWVRAEHMTRWGCRLLTIAGSGATATAIYLTESGGGPGASLLENRAQWFLTVATFLLGGVLIHRLVLRLREYVALLDAQARTDTLTGLPNRRAWDDELPHELARCRREGRPVCVAMLDLDHFKAFNDSRGHHEGDVLLRRAAAAWQSQLQGNDFIARLGGEEFGLILRNRNLPDAAVVVETLRQATPDRQTCSVGLATWNGSESPQELTGRADDALYAAKGQGRDRLTVAEWNHAAPPPPQGWLSAVRDVIDEGAIMAAYQPVVALDDSSVLGYESLARTCGRSTGMPIAEVFANARRMGLTRELDWLCRRAAMRGVARMPHDTLLFLNISLAALLDPLHDVDQMLLLLAFHHVDSSRIVLEVSEREPVSDRDRFREVLASYRAAGFRFAVDDIGEGRSALETLVSATPEFCKVSPSLTRAVPGTTEYAALCAVLAFAANSDTTIVAEGVESAEQAVRLGRLGVRWGQGYHLSRPSFDTAGARALEVAG